MMEKLKILTKLHGIMAKVNFIAKDKTNDYHHYDYASEQAIKETLHKELVNSKVLFMMSTSNIRRVSAGEKGSMITDVDVAYTFHDIESGESIEGTFVGTGEDKLDKGTYKAITGALKYILTSTFLIPTGDDPEKEPKGEARQVVVKKTYQKPAQPQNSSQTHCSCGGAYKTVDGKFGTFLSCSNYPKCKIKAPKIQKPVPSDDVPPEFDDSISFPSDYN